MKTTTHDHRGDRFTITDTTIEQITFDDHESNRTEAFDFADLCEHSDPDFEDKGYISNQSDSINLTFGLANVPTIDELLLKALIKGAQ